MKDVNELIQKVHEHIEGRYDLNAMDMNDIFDALCELQKILPKEDPREVLDDSWIHDVDMGCR